MNTVTNKQPPPLQPPRSSFRCERHHNDNYNGFCPSCLCERLTVLDQSATGSSSSRRSSTSSTTAGKSTFKAPSSTDGATEANRNKLTTATTTTSYLPELRRTKSVSVSKNESLGYFAGVFEPQRKSCDVRGRSTLWSLFSIDDENKSEDSSTQRAITSTGADLETKNENEEDKVNNDGEIRVSEERELQNLSDLENDIVEMEAKVDAIVDNLKSLKDHMDLDAHSKKPSSSNIWSAASKKWQKWRRKQKTNVTGRNDSVSSRTLPVEKRNSRRYRETQSEIGDYGFGRRSCDIDPRFSLDAGRVSFEDPHYSFDNPRASCDGHVIGRSFPRLPPMVEYLPVVNISRSDMVEEPVISENIIPGGSIQTREYYFDSSSKRRKSLDRSNSIRKMAAAVVAEIDDRRNSTTSVSNAKVSPATVDYNHIHRRSKFHSIGGEIELERHSNSNTNSLRDDGSETFNKEKKKSRWWNLKLWKFTNRQPPNRGGGIEAELRGAFNGKLGRSNSSVSWRNTSINVKKSNSDENTFVFDRNSSARSGTGSAKSRLSTSSHSIARNMLRLY